MKYICRKCSNKLTKMQAEYKDCPECFVRELEEELTLKKEKENKASK